MSNQSYKRCSKNIYLILLFLLINLSFSENPENNLDKSPILYPSVLSLQNKGIVVVQTDGIHFYDLNKVEEESKKIKFETPIISEKENEKISMSQFPEKEGGFIIILVREKLYLIQSSGYLLKEENLPEMTLLENVKIIPYKEEENNLLYLISYKTASKQFGFNYYKFDLINKKNSLMKIKILDTHKNPVKINTSNADIFGSSCLFMKNLENEDVFTCFLGVAFPAEIQARIFSIKNDEFEEKNSYKYLIGHYEIESFNLISAIPNEQRDSTIIYYYKNKILTKIDFDFVRSLSSPNAVTIDVNLPDEYWKLESEIMKESKESIFSSRLYWANCKSYMIFFNSNFSLTNKGFISHDNKCANLLSYSNFFKDNHYALNVDSLNNNKILVRKKRSLAGSAVSVPEKCKQDSSGYSDESISFNLCLLCDNNNDYYRVYDPNKTIYDNGKGFVQCFNETTKKNFYLDKSGDTSDKTKWVYKPCYETCETCIEGGDAYDHKCKTCALRYKFFNDSEEGKKLCEAECSYAYYYTYPLEYYECTETNSCPDEAPYLVPAIRKCVRNCIEEEGYEFRYAGNCYANCPANTDIDKNTTTEKTCKDKTGVNAPRCVATYSSINSDDFITSEGIRTKAQTYAKEFANTLTHIDYYNNSDAILIIYKDPTCITELNLKVPKIDLDDSCDAKIIDDLKEKHADFDESTDLIIALVGGESTSKNIKSSFSYFYKDGTYVNISEICTDVTVQVIKQVDLEQVDDEAEVIAAQGIDIFDADSPFYTDICFMYDSPNGKDATPNDRLNTYFPNISLCETGCTPDGVNLTTFEVNCKCEFSDIMSSTGVGEKLLEDSFGEVFEMIDNSNIVIFKCGKDVFVAKHFFKNVGSYIVLGIMVAEIACIVVYYLISYNPMQRYLYYLCEYQCSAIEMKNNNKGDKDKDKNKNKNKDNILTAKLQKAKAPPKKDENTAPKTPAVDKLIDEDPKKPKKLDINEPNVINSENKLLQKKEEKNEKDNLKKVNKNEKKPMYADKLKEDYDIEMDEYLKTDVDDMEFEDALKYDKRSFCEYFCENFKNEQIIMDTVFNRESLKPMTIKIIIFLLNVVLYFVINGLFYSEEYVSDLFNSDDEEHFFSFFPRSIKRFIYTTIVGEIISIIVDFVAFDENKVKRLFRREKKNTLQIRYEISVMTKDIKRNYLILMIICGVIDLISLYYVNCFNNVYPNLTGEWIKSSICIMIIIQVLSILRILLETAIRALAFRCKSERIYKIKDLLD